MTKYKLNVARDIDPDGDDGFILNLPYGFRFYDDIVHVKGFDSIREIKQAIKNGEVVPCDCNECVSNQSDL
jgi:hypothetical protein